MIYYDEKVVIGVLKIFAGSVLPRALPWAVSNGLYAAVVHISVAAAIENSEAELFKASFKDQMTGIITMWTLYSTALGYMLVFRNNQGYNRFWEGATLVNRIRGEWFNATCSLMSFCSMAKEKEEQVAHFQHLLLRLMSLLYCHTLRHVCEVEEASLEVIDLHGLDEGSMRYLAERADGKETEIIMGWIQRLLVKTSADGIICVSPPVLSRSFEELSRGIVTLSNLRKIRDIPFPFPYAQTLVLTLLVHWVIGPIVAAFTISEAWWASVTCGLVQGGLWAVVLIAQEIDQPFGDDPNDLPLLEMQKDFNASLLGLLTKQAREVPIYKHTPDRGISVSRLAGRVTNKKRYSAADMSARYRTGEMSAQIGRGDSQYVGGTKTPFDIQDANSDMRREVSSVS
mmetsp:Transcript_26571/g.48073  ORF Transcript_26571/g.48073 Transcript_26571/m.48073 type:complete len:399 (-) Transcript_26571:254-1450(-)